MLPVSLVKLRAEEVRKDFPGTWTIRSHPLAYRILPKCACSTVGQVMHYIEKDCFFPGTIHDDRKTIMKWGHPENKAAVIEVCNEPNVFSFTFVRNPYRRILSAFADKIFGYQASGGRYRGGKIHEAAKPFGVRFDASSNIFNIFNGFVKFIASSTQDRALTDIHWAGMAHHLRYNIHSSPSWKLDFVGYVESIAEDLQTVIKGASVDPMRVPQKIPQENTTSIGFSCEEMYRPETASLVRKLYADDFEVFGYSKEVKDAAPAEKREAGDVVDRLTALYKAKGCRV